MKRAVAALAALLVLAGCSSSGGSSSSKAPSGGNSSAGKSAGVGTAAATSQSSGGTVAVYAASSLTAAFTTLKSQFEKAHPGTTVRLTFGASSDLSAQINQGAPVDVFASASPKNMASVVSAGQATDPVTFTTNTAEIAVPPSNPGKITSLSDLARKGVKVAVCAPAVPCGALATKVFANAKLTVKPVANEKDVKSTLAVVESGDVDAGVVYVTDVRSAGAKVKGVKIPASVNASTAYPIVALKHAKDAALAKAFVALVTSAQGKQVLTADGFGSS